MYVKLHTMTNINPLRLMSIYVLDLMQQGITQTQNAEACQNVVVRLRKQPLRMRKVNVEPLVNCVTENKTLKTYEKNTIISFDL